MFSSLARQAARRSLAAAAKPRAFRAPVWRRTFSATGASRQEEESGAAEVEEGSLKRPTVQEVQMLPRHVSEYTADLLISAALHGDHDAIRERLVREVMRVDGVEWRIANGTVEEMGEANRNGLAALKLPYILGVTVGFVSAWGCLPLVFDLGTAEAFNTAYVTMEHPQPEDVETWLEVGSWTWGWMEPVLGTISFQLLALQLMRNQMVNVGFKPYTGFILSSRADRLANMYPTYNREITRDYSKSSTGLGAYSGISG